MAQPFDRLRRTQSSGERQETLALIEYWAVDPDYDGKVFRSVWQDYRGNTANDEDALRVVDVFGFEAEVVATVGVA